MSARPRATPSRIENQLRAAIDAECGPLPPRCGVPGLAAWVSVNLRVDDPATLRAVADGCRRPAVIQILAWVGHPELPHHAPWSFRSFCITTINLIAPVVTTQMKNPPCHTLLECAGLSRVADRAINTVTHN